MTGGARVLIGSADRAAALRLAERLSAYGVQVLADPAALLAQVRQSGADLVLIDACLPGGDAMDTDPPRPGGAALDLLVRLRHEARHDPAHHDLPVVMLGSDTPDTTFETRALALGASDFLCRSESAAAVQARVGHLLRLRRTSADTLRRHEARWIAALEGAEQGVWDWDLHRGSVFLSPQWRSLMGDDMAAAPRPGGDAGDGSDGSEGSHTGDVTFDAWRARIHPDDAVAAQRRLDRHRAGISSRYDSEHRLRCSDGSYIWVREAGGLVQHDEAGRPQRMIGTLFDISRRKDAEAQAHSLAFYDPVTELPNRRKLDELLLRSLLGDHLGQASATLCLIDLDHFKLVNDTHGHEVGDQLLREVAQRLSAAVRPQDIVARPGGDEFAVLLIHDRAGPGAPSADAVAAHAQAVGAQLLALLAEPYRLGEHLYHGSASMGVVAVDADRAMHADHLLKWADIALYEAKRAGRGCLRSFDPAMQAAVEARSGLEAELRAALLAREFHLVYQLQVGVLGAKIDARVDAALGAEALVRWHHPQRGLVGPTEFIALAEETGLIVPLGRVLLEQVCRQLAAWSTDPDLRQLTVSLNISARELHEPGFVEHVIATLARTGAPVQRLKLELTESALVGDVDDIAARMHRLRAHGVGFALDDFGTGFSSLSYLKRLPFDQLKIDRSFVRDILDDSVDARLSRAIVALAASLGLSVVAEGVELAAQGELLREFGCQQFQGFLFGEPMPAEQFSAGLRAAAAVTAATAAALH